MGNAQSEGKKKSKKSREERPSTSVDDEADTRLTTAARCAEYVNEQAKASAERVQHTPAKRQAPKPPRIAPKAPPEPVRNLTTGKSDESKKTDKLERPNECVDRTRNNLVTPINENEHLEEKKQSPVGDRPDDQSWRKLSVLGGPPPLLVTDSWRLASKGLVVADISTPPSRDSSSNSVFTDPDETMVIDSQNRHQEKPGTRVTLKIVKPTNDLNVEYPIAFYLRQKQDIYPSFACSRNQLLFDSEYLTPPRRRHSTNGNPTSDGKFLVIRRFASASLTRATVDSKSRFFNRDKLEGQNVADWIISALPLHVKYQLTDSELKRFVTNFCTKLAVCGIFKPASDKFTKLTKDNIYYRMHKETPCSTKVGDEVIKEELESLPKDNKMLTREVTTLKSEIEQLRQILKEKQYVTDCKSTQTTPKISPLTEDRSSITIENKPRSTTDEIKNESENTKIEKKTQTDFSFDFAISDAQSRGNEKIDCKKTDATVLIDSLKDRNAPLNINAQSIGSTITKEFTRRMSIPPPPPPVERRSSLISASDKMSSIQSPSIQPLKSQSRICDTTSTIKNSAPSPSPPPPKPPPMPENFGPPLPPPPPPPMPENFGPPPPPPPFPPFLPMPEDAGPFPPISKTENLCALPPPPPPMPTDSVSLTPTPMPRTYSHPVPSTSSLLVESIPQSMPKSVTPPLPSPIPGISAPPPPPMPGSFDLVQMVFSKMSHPPPPPPFSDMSQPSYPPIPEMGLHPAASLSGPIGPAPLGFGGPSPLPPPPIGGWNPASRAVMRKQPLNPHVPMKPLYWTRILVPSVETQQDSLWGELEEDNNLDMKEFADLFSRQVVERQPTKKKDEVEKVSKIQPAKILDPKRSKTVGILEKSLHVDFSEVENAIYNMDTSVVSLEALHQIYEIRPTAQELESIAAHESMFPDIPLDRPEQFLKRLSGIIHFAEKIACMMFQSEYHEAISLVATKLTNIRATCDYLQNSNSLKRIMAMILTLGNYMNGGNRMRGQADGFGLEILSKLKDVKSKIPGVTLLHYLVRLRLEQEEDYNFTEPLLLPVPEPADIREACEINFDDIEKELDKLDRELTACQKKCNIVVDADLENAGPFKREMDAFLQRATEELTSEREGLIEARNKFKKVMQFYQYKPKGATLDTADPKDFFLLWAPFCDDFKDIWKKEQQRMQKEKNEELRRKINKYEGEKVKTVKKSATGIKARLQKLASKKQTEK